MELSGNPTVLGPDHYYGNRRVSRPAVNQGSPCSKACSYGSRSADAQLCITFYFPAIELVYDMQSTHCVQTCDNYICIDPLLMLRLWFGDLNIIYVFFRFLLHDNSRRWASRRCTLPMPDPYFLFA